MRGASQWQARVSGEVWVWMNLEGEGVIWGGEDRMFLRPGMYAIFGEDEAERWRWTRLPGKHRAEVVILSRPWLSRRIGGNGVESLHPDFASWLTRGGRLSFAGLMTGPERDLAEGLAGLDPEEAAAPLWVESRVLEWSALRLYRRSRADAGAGFCQQFVARTPVERALAALREALDEPLDLGALGRRCGVAPSHLSRLVKRETGRTLRQHQRRLRVGLACDLLRGGQSVTEVAMEVGYQSLSHFAKAFREEAGKSPREWRAECA